MPRTITFLMPVDETFDVGSDTCTSANEQDHQVPFAFNGTIERAVVEVTGPVVRNPLAEIAAILAEQ